MKQLADKTIGEIVAENYRTAAVFQKYNIDFCCKGNRLLSDVCAEKGIDMEDLLDQVQRIAQEQRSGTTDYDSWPLDLLADYIEKKHHRYVEYQIPILKKYLKKVCAVHGNKHPELLRIAELFHGSAGELAAHMKKEEFILFPYIRKMVKAQYRPDQRVRPHFGTVKNPIQTMIQEHDNEGNRFREINQLSNNYTPPDDACQSYRVVFDSLKEFEDDLHLHIHLENNILFPKAVEMEHKQLAHE